MLLNPRLNFAPENVRRIHLMGICGTGMAALAGMLQHSGYTITGSDSHVYPPMSDFLKQMGIEPFDGYSENNLDHNPDLVIVGNVITKKNPEAIALAENSTPYLSFPQALADFYIGSHRSIVVCGTHGKTTTCSLLASALFHTGTDPSFMIGGIVSEFQSNNRIGKGEFFITEGDEYDTAFFDKGSKFLHYRPQIAIITSVEFDHADIFTDLDQIKASFKKFVELLPADGVIVAHLDDPNVAEVVADAPCLVEGYGSSPENIWQLLDQQAANTGTRFSFRYKKEEQCELHIPLSGTHNCLNSLAVAAVMHHINIPMDKIQTSLSSFKGVKRRQEVRGKEGGVVVIDDFAHHPTAVEETLKGLRKAYEGHRLITVFEPRTNSSRRSIFQKRYAESFAAADMVILREPVPLADVPAENQFSSVQLAKDLQLRNIDARAFPTTKEILDRLEHLLIEGDVVAILSNGGFDNIHERLLSGLKSRDKGSTTG